MPKQLLPRLLIVLLTAMLLAGCSTLLQTTPPCNAVEVMAEVTAPDGVELPPGAPASRVWRLRNAGSCTWSSAYRLVRTGGEALAEAETLALPNAVAPGETVDLGLKLIAPPQAGMHESQWKLESDTGEQFGPGADQSGVLTAALRVMQLPATPTATQTVEPPTATVSPTAQATASITPSVIAAATGLLTPGAVSDDPQCNRAWLEEIRGVAEGATLKPGETFTWTWKLKNVGTCTWNADYALVFSTGNSLSGPLVVRLNRTVIPQTTADLTINLTAPAAPGFYTGSWVIKSASGQDFGVGEDAREMLTAAVQVEGVTQTAPTGTYTPAATLAVTPKAEATTAGTAQPLCNKVGKVVDVTVPDLTVFLPNWQFVKTWRLENAGTCTWTPSYKLVFNSGNPMSAPKTVALTQMVKPGETVDVAVNLISPSEKGDYISYWTMSDYNGAPFGTGAKGNGVFWVKVEVVERLKEPFPMHLNYCDAEWTSSKGKLTGCPMGKDDFVNGSLGFTNSPFDESGRERRDQNSLVVVPSEGKDGFVKAVFPPYFVQVGDRLTTTVGCLHEAQDCNVTFKLGYLDEKGIYRDLVDPMRQTYDGGMKEINLVLGKVKNQMVRFVLWVENNGSSADDRAVWIYPTVWRDR